MALAVALFAKRKRPQVVRFRLSEEAARVPNFGWSEKGKRNIRVVGTGSGLHDSKRLCVEHLRIVSPPLCRVHLRDCYDPADHVMTFGAEDPLKQVAGAFSERERFIGSPQSAKGCPKLGERIPHVGMIGPECLLPGLE
jgi:hypothetical protein